jgi:hypothetical protein
LRRVAEKNGVRFCAHRGQINFSFGKYVR